MPTRRRAGESSIDAWATPIRSMVGLLAKVRRGTVVFVPCGWELWGSRCHVRCKSVVGIVWRRPMTLLLQSALSGRT